LARQGDQPWNELGWRGHNRDLVTNLGCRPGEGRLAQQAAQALSRGCGIRFFDRVGEPHPAPRYRRRG
jgi:hypothetical protein